MTWKNDQVTEAETERILALAREVLNARVPGDLVEMGCYRGDTSLLLAEILRDFGDLQSCACGKPVENSVEKFVDNVVENPAKKLWIYDSFEGLPEKSEEDQSALGENFRGGELFVTKREVKERFLRAGLAVPVIKKAWFADLTEADLPEKIAFSFLDGDFYESILTSLRLIWGKMVPGGVVIVHDYNNPALPGVKKAVDEFLPGEKVEVYQSMGVIHKKGLAKA